MKRELIPVTEEKNQAAHNLDLQSVAALMDLMHTEELKAMEAINKVNKEIETAITSVVETFKNGGRLFYIGAGTSGRLGMLDAVECPPTFGVDPTLVQAIIAGGENAMLQAVEGAEDDALSGRLVVHEKNINQSDMVLGISASGSAQFVLAALHEAKQVGAKVWLLTCNCVASELDLDGVICVNTGPEILAGSTRLKAGTVTKSVLNMITTIAMVKLGKVYGNLMVDLKPTNVKLRLRAARIIAEITGCTQDEAVELLKTADYKPKIAALMKLKNLSKVQATELLVKHQGFLRAALNAKIN